MLSLALGELQLSASGRAQGGHVTSEHGQHRLASHSKAGTPKGNHLRQFQLH